MDSSFLLFFALPVAFVLIVIVVLYNSLISKRNAVDFAFSCIDVQLKKRFDLIPNLVNTVKGYAQYEADVLREVTALRANLARTRSASRERFAIEKQITQTLPAVFAVAENYPDLKADKHFLNLQHNLTEIEEQISAARRAFSAAIYEYNNAVKMFPSNVIANMFGFRERAFFETGANERHNVKVF